MLCCDTAGWPWRHSAGFYRLLCSLAFAVFPLLSYSSAVNSGTFNSSTFNNSPFNKSIFNNSTFNNSLGNNSTFNNSPGNMKSPTLSFFSTLESHNFSEPVPIEANFDKWQTDNFQPGERIYSKQSAYLGLGRGNTQLGYHSRLHYYLDFSKDTSLWYYLEKNNKQALQDIKRPLDIFLNINHVEARGYFLAHRFHWNHFALSLRAHYLRLNEITYGAGWGNYQPTLNLENQTQLTVDYSYSQRETILDREVSAPSGSGWIFDYALAWQQDKHRASVAVDDAWSRLHWQRVPASRIQGNLVNLEVRRDAALQFEEFYSELQQSLPAHTRFSYQYQWLPRLALGLGSEKFVSKRWNRVFVQTPLWPNATASLAYSPEDKLAKFALHDKYFFLQLEANDSSWEAARVLNFSLGLHLPFPN